MFEDYNICPYPGLRTFSEEESIYFKGRDSHTEEVVKLLEKNKFLMVTGASGDGKSSLIFSGLIPNARAGFFKAKYTSWKVAHFKPERTPLKNLAESVASEFNVTNSETLETEFNRGFSSLVDQYLNSNFYDDNPEFKKGSNLLIIADQFEEFFTNPENFSSGSPTQSAQIAVNLLLETARIAIEKDLPIYVVITMRSDYIGQCSSFRGLPEFIGYSQFFVPRLKRKDLVQVIEEPAELSGNKITRRLAERIIYDLEDGVDQLPLLQHALNQIWRAADDGKETMDLIHYAMVGGLPKEDLPDEDFPKFEKWFSNLEIWKRDSFNTPGLNSVLDIHADLLYMNTYKEYEVRNPGSKITAGEVSRALAMVFICLTKIDDSRAVRNRMTLDEICKIINNPNITAEILSGLIEVFRAPGNTLITPFISEEDLDSVTLNPDSVLDITHESLIRNWKRLDKWAWKEFEYFEILQDLQKQVNHWVENGKSKRFLLPIGPLMYFEDWVQKANPNKFWIRRYQELGVDKGEKLKTSENQLSLINEFLGKSSKKLFLTKFVSTVGLGRISVALSLVAVTIFCCVMYYQSLQKQNEKIIEQALTVGDELVKNEEIAGWNSMIYFYLSNLYDSSRNTQVLESVNKPEYKYGMVVWSYVMLNYTTPYYRDPYKVKLLKKAIGLALKTANDSSLNETSLQHFCTLSYGIFVDEFFNPGSVESELKEKFIGAYFDAIINIIDRKDINFNTGLFNKSIDLLLNLGLNDSQLETLLNKLSPFRTVALENFGFFFPKEKYRTVGYNTSINYNAGFQSLASIYAAKGDVNRLIQCYDTLRTSTKGYYDIRTFNDDTSLAGFLLKYNKLNALDKFIDYTSSARNISKAHFLKHMSLRATGADHSVYRDFTTPTVYLSLSNKFPSYEQLNVLLDRYINAVKEEYSNGDERNFELALAYKNKGILLNYFKEKRGLQADSELVSKNFDSALVAFQRVSTNFLKQTDDMKIRYGTGDVRNLAASKREQFIYPDHIGYSWHSHPYYTSIFMDYIVENNLFDSFYTKVEEANLINDWIANYLQLQFDGPFETSFYLTPNLGVIEKVKKLVRSKFGNTDFDFNIMEILLAKNALKNNDSEKLIEHASLITTENLESTTNSWRWQQRITLKNYIWHICAGLIKYGKDDLADKLMSTFTDQANKIASFSMVSQELQNGIQKHKAFKYLDTAYVEFTAMNTVEFENLDPRRYLINALASIGSEATTQEAFSITKDIFEPQKRRNLTNLISGLVTSGNYHKAWTILSDDISDNVRMDASISILRQHIEENVKLSEDNKRLIERIFIRENYLSF